MKLSLNAREKADFKRVIALALDEDIGAGDVTSQRTIPRNARAEMRFVAKQYMVACGIFTVKEVYRLLDKKIRVTVKCGDGQRLKNGEVMAIASGPARALLTGERVILNLMQHLSGIATLTAQYVEAVEGTKAVILDTRKTLPGLRALEKYAVRAGGGRNHRMRLDDMALIKDNHIALCGGVAAAIRKARAGRRLPVIVECDTLAQVKEALAAKPDRILLDNMTPAMLRKAVQMAGGKMPLEASGGITPETVRPVARTGVDYISIGRLTHSAPAADISAEVLAGFPTSPASGGGKER